MINISNCPVSGLERKITAVDMFNQESTKTITLRCFISYFKDGAPVEKKGINSYQVDLVAATDKPVNKNTGAPAGEDTPEVWANPDVVSEYDYFKGMENISVNQSQLKAAVIEARDLQGRFNV